MVRVHEMRPWDASNRTRPNMRGRIQPVIGGTVPLSQIGAAHAAFETARSGDQALRGKVVIEVG